jgi:hypothetical protein
MEAVTVMGAMIVLSLLGMVFGPALVVACRSKSTNYVTRVTQRVARKII